MTVKIAHLYYDLMNLYGENGNIRALKKHFEDQDVKVEVSFLTINDEINFDNYDIFYIGSGTENYQRLVINDLMNKKDEVKNAVETGAHFLVTGNAIEMFGKHIIDFNGNKIDCLGIFPFYTKMVDLKNYSPNVDFRIICETLATNKFNKKEIIGFQNRCGVIYNNDYTWLTIEKGCGNNLKDKNEGIAYKNFLGTYLIGPLFIRNPHLTDYIIKKVMHEKNDKLKFKISNNEYEIKAYNKYLEIIKK